MRTYILFGALLSLSAFAAEKKVITPAGARPPVGPYSPGIMAGGYLYVSGQGAAKSDGSFPATTEQQIEQALNNIEAIVKGAGLTMQHIVYAQLYLTDMSKYDEANRAWTKAFPEGCAGISHAGGRQAARQIPRSKSLLLR